MLKSGKKKMENTEAFVLLNMTYGLGPAKIKRLIEYFGSAQRVLKAKENELLSVETIKAADAENILKFNQKELDKELRLIEKSKARVLTIADKEYPVLLKEIHSGPPVLYVKGEIKGLSGQALAIVGSRLASLYGLQTAEKFAFQLSGLGINIVSGMARGIDTAAHLGALKNKGRTVAVLGSGLNVIYPRENEKLFSKIAASGAVISEFPMNTPPEKENFPRRNRIISGLALGTIVIEAAARSGALITANFALEQNREVFAVPGNISSGTSTGTNALIKEGAKLAENIEDIISELKTGLCRNAAQDKTNNTVQANTLEKTKILDILALDVPLHIDMIIHRSKFKPGSVAGILSALEIEGCVRQLEGKRFVRTI